MQNPESTMKVRKRLCDEGLQSYERFCAKVQLENERILTFLAFVKKANHLTRSNDWDHQNRNFTVSKLVISIIIT